MNIIKGSVRIGAGCEEGETRIPLTFISPARGERRDFQRQGIQLNGSKGEYVPKGGLTVRLINCDEATHPRIKYGASHKRLANGT